MCTLFDSNYLDKGIVLHKSLIENCNEFELYILPMDKRCAEILYDLNLNNVIVIEYDKFEDGDLKRIKNERTHAEFCWTCTAKLISYVFRRYNPPFCTYVDSDLYFFDDPSILIEEMLRSGDDVQILRHNFQSFERKESEKSAGEYCVEFNTFVNNHNGRTVLSRWEKECIRDCSYRQKDDVMGDQKYLQSWPTEYKFVNVSCNQGAGVAPWNINKFKYIIGDEDIKIIDIESEQQFKLIFFHFQNVRFVENKIICCDVLPNIMSKVKKIYEIYLSQIINTKRMLKQKYGISVKIPQHPAEQEAKINKESTLKDKWINCIVEKGIAKSIIDVFNGRYRMLIHYYYYSKRKTLIITEKDLFV